LLLLLPPLPLKLRYDIINVTTPSFGIGNMFDAALSLLRHDQLWLWSVSGGHYGLHDAVPCPAVQ
jgi:hypothetical protein